VGYSPQPIRIAASTLERIVDELDELAPDVVRLSRLHGVCPRLRIGCSQDLVVVVNFYWYLSIRLPINPLIKQSWLEGAAHRRLHSLGTSISAQYEK
jgi:hypothetical protein